MTANDNALIPTEPITQFIVLLRGKKILLDTDLALLYDVPTKRFNEQVRRNLERFPADFMFQLTDDEWAALRSQFATLKSGRGQHRKYFPFAFTEHGAIMAATILSGQPRREPCSTISLPAIRAFSSSRCSMPSAS